jgi:hypothetical protein
LPTNLPKKDENDLDNAQASEGSTYEERAMHEEEDNASVNNDDDESVASTIGDKVITQSGRTVPHSQRFDDSVSYSCDIIQEFGASTNPDRLYMLTEKNF